MRASMDMVARNLREFRPEPLAVQPAWVGKSTFREDYPEATAIALYRGSERLRIDDVWCLPVADFLRNMRPDRALLPMPGRGDAL